MPNKSLAIAPGEVADANFEFHDGTQLVIAVSRNGVVGDLYMTIASRPAGEIIGTEAELQISANGNDKFVLTAAMLGVVQETVKHYHNVWSVRAGTAAEGADGNGLVYDLVAKGQIDKLAAIRMVSAAVPATAPAFTSNPVISGTLEVGQTLTVGGYSYTGTEPVSEVFQWKRNGANISGATSQTHQLVAVDDGAAITCSVTLANGTLPNATATAPSTGTVTYPAPTATGSLSDVTITLDAGNATRDAGALFTGAIGGSWSVTVDGGTNASVATINSAGVVTVYDDATISSATIVATYTNSGGSASREFSATVWQVPAQMAAPTLVGGEETLTIQWPAAPDFYGAAFVRYNYDVRNTVGGLVASGQQADLTDTVLTGVAAADVTATVWATSEAGDGAPSPVSNQVTVTPATQSDRSATLAEYTTADVRFDSGAAQGLSSATLPYIGTTDAGDGAIIEARTVYASDLAEHSPWAEIATAASGTYSGDLTGVPRPAGARVTEWLRREVRVKNSSAPVTRSVGRCVAGHVISIWQQSEHHRAVQSAHANTGNAQLVTDPEALLVTFKQGHEASVEHRLVSDEDPVFGHLTAMSNTFSAARPGEKFHVVFQTMSGTSLQSLLDDTDDLPDGSSHGAERRWADDKRLYDAAHADGNLPGLNWMSWYAADAALGGAMCDLWYAALLEKLPDGTPVARGDTVHSVKMDHFFTDLYDLSVSPFVIAGPHRFESDSYNTAAPAIRQKWDELFADPDFAAVARRGTEITAYQNGSSDTIHPDASSVDGYQRLLTYTALDMLDQMGLASYDQPEFDGSAVSFDMTYVEVWSTAGDIITTRGARAEALPAGTPSVWGFKWNDTLATETEIVNGRVRIYWNAAKDEIPRGSVLEFADQKVGSLPVSPDYVWKDYPLVDLGQTGVEGIPVKPLPGKAIDAVPKVITIAENTKGANLASTAWSSGRVAAKGWQTPAEGWTLNGDGVLITNSDTEQGGGNAGIAYADVVGKELEIEFYLDTPGGAVGDLLVEVTEFGGGSTDALNAVVTPQNSGEKIVVTTAAITGSHTDFGIKFQRTDKVGEMRISGLAIRDAAATDAPEYDAGINHVPQLYSRSNTMATSYGQGFIAGEGGPTWAASAQFLNLIKGAGGFEDVTKNVVVDANGYPISWDGEGVSSRMLWVADTELIQQYPFGPRYVLMGQGLGEVRIGFWDGRRFVTTPGTVTGEGTTVQEYTATDGSGDVYWAYHFEYDKDVALALYIFDNDSGGTGEPLRNFALIHEDDLTDYLAGVRLRPEDVENAKTASGDIAVANGLPRGATRTMGPDSTNGIDWDGVSVLTADPLDRYVPPTYYSYNQLRGGAGTAGLRPIEHPIETWVEFCNATGTNLHKNLAVNIPDAKFVEMATYVDANLRSDLNAHWEFGNELWNVANGFDSWQYCTQRVSELGWSVSGTFAAYEYAAWRTSQMWDLMAAIGTIQSRSKFVVGVSGWTDDSWDPDTGTVSGDLERYLDCPNARADPNFGTDVATIPHILAQGAYFGDVDEDVRAKIISMYTTDDERVRALGRIMLAGVNGDEVELDIPNIGNPQTGISPKAEINAGWLLIPDVLAQAPGNTDKRILWSPSEIENHLRLNADGVTVEYRGASNDGVTWEPVMVFTEEPSITFGEMLEDFQLWSMVNLVGARERNWVGFQPHRAAGQHLSSHQPAAAFLGWPYEAYEAMIGAAVTTGQDLEPFMEQYHRSHYAAEALSIYTRIMEAGGMDAMSIYTANAFNPGDEFGVWCHSTNNGGFATKHLPFEWHGDGTLSGVFAPPPAPNLAAQNWVDGVGGVPGGWGTPAASGWTLGGDGTVSSTTINSTQGGQPFSDHTLHEGKTLELSFTLSTPDGATGDLLITSTMFGGGSESILNTGDFTPVMGENVITFTSPVPAGRSGLGLAWTRRTSATGTFVFSNLRITEA